MSDFIAGNPENADHNQYWYSNFTIQKMVEDLVVVGGRIGFLSTPSIYFTMPEDLRSNCFVFDFDKKWESDRGFVFYDFNDFENVPAELLGSFDCVVIDPPFITHEVWQKYANTAKLLLKTGQCEDGSPAGKVLGTTVAENAPFLNELFGCTSQAFKPSIPNLVYQYDLYTNYPSAVFSKANPEIPE